VIKEVLDPLNTSFTSGFRFSLVGPNKYRVYFTENEKAFRGACDFAEKDLNVACDTLVTDVINFGSVDGGDAICLTGRTERKVLIKTDSDEFQLSYDPRTTVASIYQKKEGQFTSLASENLDLILRNRDFLDNERESLADPLYYFLTQATLTTMAGLPSEMNLKVGDTSVSFTRGSKEHVVDADALSSIFFADYLSKVM